MDTGQGKFEFAENLAKQRELEEKYPNHGAWFKIGDVIEIYGSKFRVKSVKPTELRLKLLPREK